MSLLNASEKKQEVNEKIISKNKISPLRKMPFKGDSDEIPKTGDYRREKQILHSSHINITFVQLYASVAWLTVTNVLKSSWVLG